MSFCKTAPTKVVQDMTEYDRQQAARQDLDALLTQLNMITDDLSFLAETIRNAIAAVPRRFGEGDADILKQTEDRDREYIPQYAEALRGFVYQLIGTLHALVDAGPGQPPDLAFSAIAQFSALKSAVDDAPSLNNIPKTLPPVSWDWTKGAVEPVWTRLWSLISHLTRVKELSVSGSIDTGPLGMAKAQISVTFG
jgi:hypothetical protein